MREQVDAIPVAVRAWAVPDYLRHLERLEMDDYRDLGPSRWQLVLDTETLTDLSQRLRVGAYQLRRHGALKQTGLFYDPETLSEKELDTIIRYANRHSLEVMTRDEFAARVFFRYAYYRRALVIGFNLPFDISRLAIDHSPAKGHDRKMRGGFSFALSTDPRLPRVQVKRAGARAAFIRFTIPGGRDEEKRNRERGGDLDRHRGYFVDVAQLAGALIGGRYTLARLADLLNTTTRKQDSDGHGGRITATYLRYLSTDVQVTWQCYEKLTARYESFGLVGTPSHHLYSEASVGKALLRELGLQPWRKLQPDVPDWLVATIMETYYGGRCECAIRRTPVPGVYVDFVAEYPTTFVLMNLWPYVTSTGISWTDENPQTVRMLLERVRAEDVLDKALWPQLHALCLIKPDGDGLPTRARYRRLARSVGRHRSGSLNVGLAIRQSGAAQWYTLADCIASKLETGNAPRVARVLRFRPLPEQQPNLRTVKLGGDARYRIDPRDDDLIQRLVELRADAKQQRDTAMEAGGQETAARLDAIQLAMKTTANGIAYGTPIEMNVIEFLRPVDATVYRPDGTSYRTRSRRMEEPGTWFHPLLATLVAAGGRLLLATAMALVRQRDGHYAFCDTDSLFIVATRRGRLIPCPGGSRRMRGGKDAIRALAWKRVAEIIHKFGTVNPYDRSLVPGSILELENENFDPETGRRREIYCLSLAAKRYALFLQAANGRPELIGDTRKRRRSEHGLGHLIPPTDPKHDPGGSRFRDRWWEHLLCQELNVHDPEPDWFDEIAAGRLTVGSRNDERGFDLYNEPRGYLDRIRPGSFLMLAHVSRLERASRGVRCLVAPYERDPVKRRKARWIAKHDPKAAPTAIRTGEGPILDESSIGVQTYRDYFDEYHKHPEAKALAPDGRRCHPWTRGLLKPHVLKAAAIERVGKESTPLTDALPDEMGCAVDYPERLCLCGCGSSPGGRKRWLSDAHRKRASRAIVGWPRRKRASP